MAFDKYNGVLLQTYKAGFEEQDERISYWSHQRHLQTYQGGFKEQDERISYWSQRRRDAEILILEKIPSQCLIINKIEGDEQKTHQSFILSDMIRSLEENYNDIMEGNGGLINQNPEFHEAMTNALIILKSFGIPLTSTMEEIFQNLIKKLTKS